MKLYINDKYPGSLLSILLAWQTNKYKITIEKTVNYSNKIYLEFKQNEIIFGEKSCISFFLTKK
jgi:hypothetical protein